MNYRFSIILISALIAGISPAMSQANTSLKGMNELSLDGGAFITEGNSALKNSSLLGLRFGRYLNNNTLIEGSVFLGRSDLRQTTERADVLIPSLKGVYLFGSTDKKLRLFAGAGMDVLRVMPDLSPSYTDFMPEIMSGVRWTLTPSFFARAQAGYGFDWDRGDGQNNLIGSIGIGWIFRNPFECAAATVSSPPDSDKDGVQDHDDQCPDTPTGVEVDSRGCPLDTDEDKIPNYQDECPQTPRGTEVDSVGCPVASHRVPTEDWTLSNIEFDFDSYKLDDSSRKRLDEVAEILQVHSVIKVQIDGHTDNWGPDSYNMTLSLRRANIVRAYLETKGIAPNRMSTKGFGATKPIASNTTRQGRSLNRRVDFVVIREN